jgi:hypothetical protein
MECAETDASSLYTDRPEKSISHAGKHHPSVQGQMHTKALMFARDHAWVCWQTLAAT